MVPVNVRDEGAAGEFGNRISFIFLELPCEEPGAEQRLRAVTRATERAKASGEPAGATTVLDLAAAAPASSSARCRGWWRARARSTSWCRTSPGRSCPMWMLGCRLREAYPIVPLADRHALSIGFTSVDGGAFFGIYADRDAGPDAELLARDIGDELDELLALAPAGSEEEGRAPCAT